MIQGRDIRSDSSSRDAGVALIFALAVLALLLVMLVGFLASSILEHRIAYNQSSQVAARIAVRSALSRAVFQLKNYCDDLAWFESETNKTDKLTAPLVSSAKGDTTLTQTASNSATSAYSAMKPFLEKYLTPDDNWFNTARSHYPQWIELKANDRITGRFAYIVVPNLGINPAVMGDGGEARVGSAAFTELPLPGLGFLTSSGISKVTDMENWLSFDLMTGGQGIHYADSTYINPGASGCAVKTEFPSSANVANRDVVQTYLTADKLEFEEKSANSTNWLPTDTDRVDLSTAVSQSDAYTLFRHISDGNLRSQLAANLTDYTDPDINPTSNLGNSTWDTLLESQHPTYTGAEKAPHIANIYPYVAFKTEYRATVTDNGDDATETVVQTLTVSDITVDIGCAAAFPQYLKNTMKYFVEFFDFKLNLVFTATLGGSAMSGSPATLEGSKAKITLPEQNVSSYQFSKVLEKSNKVDFKKDGLNFAGPLVFTKTISDHPLNTSIPIVKLNVAVGKVKFLRALLKTKDGTSEYVYTDYVRGNKTKGDGTEYTGSTYDFGGDLVTYTFNPPTSFPYIKEESYEGMREFRAANPYANLELIGNQAGKPEEFWTHGSWKTDLTVTDPPTLTDPCWYIRNAPMQSPWELAFINRHGGGDAAADEKYLQIGMAVSPLDPAYATLANTYENDGILLDRITFGTDDSNCKFNLNLPTRRESAFRMLTRGLRYHKVGDETYFKTHRIVPTSGTGEGDLVIDDSSVDSDIETLSADAANELAKWIAYRCYESHDHKPDDSGSKCYSRYIHRGMLGPVITDWLKNGKKSPYNNSPSDGDYAYNKTFACQRNELLGKIAALTRCGDTYEYFTIFAIGQAVKDLGGGKKVFYKYDGSGNLITSGTDSGKNVANFGTFDDGIDQITAETYLVARVRRAVNHCEGTQDCKMGIHDTKCTFTLTVLESHTIDEL